MLPPRGIFIPTHIIFNPQLPTAILVTWIQLRSLAWDGWDTPSLSMQELTALTGKSQARLYRHMSQLRHLAALSWRSTREGSIIVSFADEPSEQNMPNKKPPSVPDSKILDSKNLELPYPRSYFPSQILGYLSFEEDKEGLQNVKEDSTNLKAEGGEEAMNFPNSQNRTPDQHAIFLKQSLHEEQKGNHACV